MAFGWLYGSVFAIEHLVDPLWVAPLQAPLLILGVPLVGGAVLLLLGLALNAVGAWWRGCFDEWLRADAGGVLVYIGLLLALVVQDALWLAVAGLSVDPDRSISTPSQPRRAGRSLRRVAGAQRATVGQHSVVCPRRRLRAGTRQDIPAR